ncbi:ferredoxin [Paenarthrobacter sp. AB444]|uniref:ferredoxin n=1 Tax=Paenarthrobacter sp. AB444 TaxID=3025681 RepID=UPI002366046E|nr:ferredoxin [Paenarthrobacter sp. AB444]MDD7833914.1 ferredoxin [Paenarthrobacter sp. AB444]
MKIALDQEKCVASGQCVTAADAVFDQRDEDGIAVLLDVSPGPEREAEVRQAAAVCPVLAIRIES